MDPFSEDLTCNELDLDMLDPIDFKFDYDWDATSNSCTTEDLVPYYGFENPQSSYTWAFPNEEDDFSSSS